MAQKPQIIDITKSYLPGDPNSFVQNLVNTDREDGEEKTLPVVPYEGYNFLPTSYGYKSFFGTNSKLNISALTSRAQHILLYQLPNFKNRLIALCEDGIWIAIADGYFPNWIQVVTDTYSASVFEEWTWCVIENVLYMYKQGKDKVYKTGLGTLTLPLIPGVTGVSGVLITDPTVYQSFTVTDGGAGSAIDFGVLETLKIYVSYKKGTDYSDRVQVGTLVANATTSVNIAVGGSAPVSGLSIRVWIEDVDIAEIYRRDFLVTDFPIVLTDFSTMTLDMSAPPAASLYTEGTPSTSPYNVADPYYWDISRFLNSSSVLGQDAHNSAGYESWGTAYLDDDLVIRGFTPSFLNMAGQMGIFRAGLRLGFWDSSNSVSWSSNLDLSDFTPSLENLAGNTIFGYVIGRIVLCKGHGEGFIVYSTKSIVGVTFAPSGNLLWDAKKILDSSGIATSKAVTCGSTDDEHFIFSTTGIYTIGKYNSLTGVYDEKNALPELYDYLRESRDPIALKIIQDRYIFFSLYNSDYIYGKQSFYYGTVDPLLSVIDWYTPSDSNPTGGTALLKDQMWELLKNEIQGRRTKDKDGDWVPLYTTTVDRMDSRYFATWMYSRPGSETAGLLNYNTHDTNLNAIPITASIITNLAVPVSDRFGTPRTFTGIRPFWNSPGGDPYDNNQSLIAGQMDEWEAFRDHMEANKDYLTSVHDIATETWDSVKYETVAGYTVLSRDSYGNPTHCTKVLGDFITGEGNINWLTTAGPSADAAREVIMRKLFNFVYRVTQDVTVSYASTYTKVSDNLSLSGTTNVGISNTKTGEFLVTKYTSTYALWKATSNPHLATSYSLIASGAAVGFPNFSIAIGTPLRVGTTSYTKLDPLDNDAGFSYTTDGYNWLPLSNPSIYSAPGFGCHSFKIGSIIYTAARGVTNIQALTVTGTTLTANASIVPVGMTLVSTSYRAAFKLGSTYYFVQFKLDGTVTVHSTTDGTNWTAKGTLSGMSVMSVHDVVVIDNFAYILGTTGPGVQEYIVDVNGNIRLATSIASDGIGISSFAYMTDGTDLYITLNKADGKLQLYKRDGLPQQIATFTYTVERVQVNSGYSQFRALVTFWDLIQSGLYGSYDILQHVAAGVMTPKVWDSVYPSDRGTGRDQLWSYSYYTAKAAVDMTDGTIGGYNAFLPDPNAYPNLTIDGYDESGITNAHSSFTLPGTTFVLQTGSIETSYPTYVGALVYDIQLKKWGKFKGDHKVLLETYPINSAENNTITYSDLGSNAAIFDAAGLVYLFDSEPLDSWIRYGKIGFQRLGMTWSGEIKVSMRYASDFRIQVDSSLTGKLLDMGLTQWGGFYNKIEGVLLTDISARWHSVKISGNYDLTGLEVRGTLAGRR